MKAGRQPSDTYPLNGQDRGYWRSLKELAHSPDIQEMLQGGLPQGGDGSPDGMSRRNFLSLMGASLALAGLTACRRPVEKIVPYVIKPEEIIPGVPQHYATSMPLAGEAWNLLVESHEGRPTHISGNRLNAAAWGSANVWATASILGLYDPDRSPTTLHDGVESSPAAFVEAWQADFVEFRANGGAGMAVLTESFASPTLSRLAAEFRRVFPRAMWVVYEPVSDEHILAGAQLAAGQTLHPVFQFDQVDVVLALDADFLGSESHQVANALVFADARRVKSERDTMNRLYLVESTLSPTAFMADHRLVLQNRQIGAFLAALCLELRRQGLDLPAASRLKNYANHAFDRAWLRAAAVDLLSHRGRSLLLAGRRQPPGVHALVMAVNAALGNLDHTVTYSTHHHYSPSSTRDLNDLVQAMNTGSIRTLAVLGGNPGYNAPADLDFPSALAKVTNSIHLSPYVDETSRRANWHIPLHHYLESWGDVSSLDGYLGVIQPLISPLYDGNSLVEFLNLLATGEDQKGYDLVRATWSEILPRGNQDKRWRKVLHDGLYETSVPKASPRIDHQAIRNHLAEHPFPADIATPQNLEIVFQLSPTLHDGRFANNGWLQELPDPVTKITWDNAALISHQTAQQLGLKNQELVYLTYQGRHLTVPIWIMPGQADYSITLSLGYGRESAGRIGTKVGFNAYLLRTVQAPYFDDSLVLKPLKTAYPLACVQDHHGLDAEKLAAGSITERLPLIIREATLEEYRQNPDFARERVEHPPLASLWEEHQYSEGYQWGMTVDLNACIGCGACTIACQGENNIPVVGKEQVLKGREMHWIRIDRYFAGSPENPTALTQPVACVHCEMAPCESVCPVAATTHDKEGLNMMVYNRCVGTRYCSNNCPYKVRRFNYFNFTKDLPESVQLAQNPDVTVRSRGVMEKCTFCLQRINLAKRSAKKEGRQVRDGEIRTACQEACPTNAITFGNVNDPRSQVARLKRQNRNYDLLGELNLRPRTSYLAKLRNPNPVLEAGGDASAKQARDDHHAEG